MGAYDFMWNAVQSGQISDMDKRVEDLEKKVEILKEWVDYLQKQLEEKNVTKNITTST